MKAEKVRDYPEPPEYLDEIGVREWDIIVPGLQAANVLSRIDLSLVAMYCNEIATYVDCQRKMREQNSRVMVIKDDNGKIKYAQQVPFQKIANEALEKALKLAAEFGLTPSARTRIGTIKESEEHDPVAELLKSISN